VIFNIMNENQLSLYRNQKSHLVPEILIQTRNRNEYDIIESHLQKLVSRPNGNELIWRIKNLSTQERYLQIIVYDGNNSVSGKLTNKQVNATNVSSDLDNPDHIAMMYAFSRIRPDMTNNFGVVGIVKFNINQGVRLDKWGFPTGENNFKENNFVSLAHELVHAYHLMNGTYYSGDPFATVKINNSAMRQEEDRAVGVGRFIGSKISENGIRIEHNLKLRAHYFSLDQIKKYGIY